MSAIRIPVYFTSGQRWPCTHSWPAFSDPLTTTQSRHHRPTKNHYRRFHASSHAQQRELPDHYKTLEVSPSASPQEIRNSFISLSKKHHPDVVRGLPDAEKEDHEQKFRAASDAWALLRDKNARAKYDRERSAMLGEDSRRASSSSAAANTRGGRPASGLSKRQSPFRGPPPSFYKQGGWGSSEAADRRRKFAEGQRERAHQSADKGQAKDAEGPRSQSRDPENWPFNGDPNDVPHFNRRQHYKTTTTVEQQMRQGRSRRREELLNNLTSAQSPTAGAEQAGRESNAEMIEQAMERMRYNWEHASPETRESPTLHARRMATMSRKIESLRSEPAIDEGDTFKPLVLIGTMLLIGAVGAVSFSSRGSPKKKADKS